MALNVLAIGCRLSLTDVSRAAVRVIHRLSTFSVEIVRYKGVLVMIIRLGCEYER
jgi:hypothetical protein